MKHKEILDYKIEKYSIPCGKFLGQGATRTVFEHKHNPDWCIKVCHKKGTTTQGANNIIEWNVWHGLDEERKKFLVKPISIHEDGVYIIMEKGIPVSLKEVPRKIPSCFSDVGSANWVKIGRRVLLADYGYKTTLRAAKLDVNTGRRSILY